MNVEWNHGAPPVAEGRQSRFWVAYLTATGIIRHACLQYSNRFAAECPDEMNPPEDAEMNADGDYLWTGWFQESCDNCDTFWRFDPEVIAWMALPRYGPDSMPSPSESLGAGVPW